MTKMILTIVSVLAAFSVQAASTPSAVGPECSFEYGISADGKPGPYQEFKFQIGPDVNAKVSNLRTIRYRSKPRVTTDELKVGSSMTLNVVGIKKLQNGQLQADVRVGYSYSELMSLRRIKFAENDDDFIEAPEVESIERTEYLLLKSGETLKKTIGTITGSDHFMVGDVKKSPDRDVVLLLKLKACH